MQTAVNGSSYVIFSVRHLCQFLVEFTLWSTFFINRKVDHLFFVCFFLHTQKNIYTYIYLSLGVNENKEKVYNRQ